MNDRKSFRFAIDAAGELRAAEFQSRSLRKVIESLLGEDWKKSPKKLLKAMAKSPDLYTAVFEARGRMIPDYIARYEVLHDKVRELSALGLKAMELTKDGLPSQDDLQADASNDIFETYAETRRNALRCHRALSLMQTASLTDWVETMDRSEFKTLTTLVKDSLERPVQTSDSLYCPLKDSPEGLALSLLMEAAPAGARKTAAKPAPKAAVKASPKSEDKPAAAADDLASRLVRGLQITPSAVEHRAPGRPRKASEPTVRKTEAAPTQRTISSRPASRNKSGGAKN